MGMIDGGVYMQPSKGFTLIELILSIAILGMIAVALLPALNTSLRNIVSAGNRTIAVENAIDEINERTNITNFDVEVELPLPSGVGTEKIMIVGDKISGFATITGSSGKNVSIFVYDVDLNQ